MNPRKFPSDQLFFTILSVIWFGFLFAWFFCREPEGVGPEPWPMYVSVESFGATPGDPKDQSEAFRKAAALSVERRVPMVIPAGVYLVRKDFLSGHGRPVKIKWDRNSRIITETQPSMRMRF